MLGIGTVAWTNLNQAVLQLQPYYCPEAVHYPESTGYNPALPAIAAINDIIERSNRVASIAGAGYIKNGADPHVTCK
jgi:hypothetical protein